MLGTILFLQSMTTAMSPDYDVKMKMNKIFVFISSLLVIQVASLYTSGIQSLPSEVLDQLKDECYILVDDET